jgi:hypothetical protein
MVYPQRSIIMILGMSTQVYTLLHVIISLAAIAAGLIAILALTANKLSSLTGFFLITTALTSITGFFFPFHGVTPGIILGILSLIVLLLAAIALHARKLHGRWRAVYIVSATLALWFNVFVLFAQLFAKVPALKAIAPTQSSPVFGATQLVVLAAFIVLALRSLKGFRSASPA